MIDNIEQMVSIARGVPGLGNRVYREYPQKVDNVSFEPYAVITRGSRVPILIDSDNSELITSLSYQIDIFAEKPTDADDLLKQMVELYKPKRILCTGISSGYSAGRMYYVTATFSVTLDIRGTPYV